MPDNVNITVNETIENVVINPSISTDVIDVNTYSTAETINIAVTPELTTVNINSVTSAPQVNSDWNATSGFAQILNKPSIPSIAGLATTTYVDTQDALKVDKVAGSRLITSAESTLLGNTSGTNTGDQDLSNLVVKNTAIVGATKTKITYDAKGLITSGADATTADIADSLNKRYVTDANLTTIGNQSGTNTGDETTATIKTKLGAATTSLDGYLTSTDWSTFNGKFNLPSLTSGSVLFSNGTTIAQDNAQLFWDDTNNRLGIGTASPTEKLTIDAGAAGTSLANFLVNGGSGARVGFLAGYGAIVGATSANATYVSGSRINFVSVDLLTEFMRITSAGNVGIGTAAPTAKLHVAAPGALSTDIALRVRNSAGSADLATIGGTGIITAAGFTQNSGDFSTIISATNFSIYTGGGFILYSGRARFGSGLAAGNANLLASAILQANSTTQGFLPPRMTNAQRIAIVTPAVGLMVYCTDVVEGLYINKSTGWTYIG